MKKAVSVLLMSVIIALSVVWLTGCENEPSAEELPVVEITYHVLGLEVGYVSVVMTAQEGESGQTVTEYGVCASVETDPTIEDHTKMIGSGVVNASLVVYINELGITTPGTYYLKAYAKNINGIQYSSAISMVINEEDLIPEVTVTSLYLQEEILKINCNINNHCAPEQIDYGFCVSNTANPTINDLKVSINDDPALIDDFFLNVTTPTSKNYGGNINRNDIGATAPGTYYFRAYCENTLGLYYSEESSIVLN